MSRRYRAFLNSTALLSLGLLLAILVLWVRSYFVADGFRWSSSGLFLSRGTAGFMVFASAPFRGVLPHHYVVRPPPPNPTGWHGFGCDQEGARFIVTTYYIPFWFFAGAVALIAITSRSEARTVKGQAGREKTDNASSES
jgi:hypothetical protein